VSDFPSPVSGALVRHLPDPAATEALGHALAPFLRRGMLVTLQGPLGSGKTALVRAILAALGHSGRVRSPTYTLVEEYDLPWGPVRHFDFYRFAETADADDAGFREHFDGSALCLVEWPERAAEWLPPAALAVVWQTPVQSPPAQDLPGRAPVGSPESLRQAPREGLLLSPQAGRTIEIIPCGWTLPFGWAGDADG
jgi:tRNA threonylcarbamoyladenosine biosynthesis protein TsaE